MPAGSFQQYLKKNRGDQLALSGKTLAPDTIRALATSLISALERAGMSALFSDASSSRDASQSTFLSTDIFMAMRNSTITSHGPAQASYANVSIQAGKPIEVTQPAAMKPERAAQQTVISPARAREKYAPIISRTANAYNLDPKLITAVIQTESGFNARAVSPVGAQGLMQLMPGTASELGLTKPFDPEQNIKAGSKYLKQLMDRYHGDTRLALAAYNWGMGNLERNPGRIPQETVNYVAKVTGLMHNVA